MSLLQPHRLLALIFALLLLLPSVATASGLRYGIDRLEAERAESLQGKRVGLIANAASLTSKGEPGYAMLLRHGVDLRFVMAPEHGFRVDIAAGQKVGDTTLNRRLPVYSLYGANRRPSPEQLGEVELLLFDLQDVGVRCYTYISTMREAMAACAATGTAFMVLDRPNPISPLVPQGFMVDDAQRSFVSAVDIPFVHAMSVGEIALLLQQRHFPDLALQVVAMQGWSRERFLDDFQGTTFTSPSPNIADVATAVVYPATVFLEATEVSEGRGTQAPFQQFGAPFIDGDRLAAALNSRNLPGVRFHPVRFTPTASKHKGKSCSGVRIAVVDRTLFSPFMVATAVLLDLHALWPEAVGIHRHAAFLDRLAGTSRFRKLIEAQAPLETILRESRHDLAPFLSEPPTPLY